MGKTVLFDVKNEMISKLTDSMKGNGGVLVVAPLAGNLSTYAPAQRGKYKGYHRIKCEVLIPDEAIQGGNAIADFAAAMLLSIPENRVRDNFKSK